MTSFLSPTSSQEKNENCVRMIGLLICRAIQGAGGRLPSRVADKVSEVKRELLISCCLKNGKKRVHQIDSPIFITWRRRGRVEIWNHYFHELKLNRLGIAGWLWSEGHLTGSTHNSLHNHRKLQIASYITIPTCHMYEHLLLGRQLQRLKKAS